MSLLSPSHARSGTEPDGARRDRRGRGQSLVEFAIILPVFLLIGFGIFDFGLAFDASLTVSNAAREGARYGVTNPNTTSITSRVRETAGRLNDTRLTVTVSCKTAAGAACAGGMAGAVSGTTLVVTVGYAYPMITPIAFGTTIPVASTAQMRVE
jgi:Flp pilus assembly protein TadG